MDCGNYAAILMIGVIWMYLWTSWESRVGYALDSMEAFEKRIMETNSEKNGGMRESVGSALKIVLLFEFFSWAVALFRSIFYYEILSWNLDDFLLDNSEFTAELLFDWGANKNDTFYYVNYGQKLNPTTVTLGCLGGFMEFASICLLTAIRDTILVLTYTLGSNIWRFISRIVDFANLPTDEVRDEDCQEMEEHWKTYLMAQDMVKDINWAFGFLVKALHVGNELFLAYFMKYCLDTASPTTTLLFMLFAIVKFLYGYIYAAVIHQYVINYF